VGHIARRGEIRYTYNILVGKPEGNRPFGRLNHRREDNIRIDLKEVRVGRFGLDSSGSG
jgi:hypothetical protein